MARINRRQVVLQPQVRFGEVLDYLNEFVHNPEKLSASARETDENHIENHIRPAWQDQMLGEFRALEIEKWLTEKGKPRIVERSGKQKLIAGLSWNTRTDLRNILSGIFTKAIEWGVWKGENPVTHVSVGRKKTAGRIGNSRSKTHESSWMPFQPMFGSFVRSRCTARSESQRS